MTYKRLTGLATLAVVATSVLFVAAPAEAALSDCPANRMCIWSGENGAGVIAYFSTGDANLGDSVGPQGMNNNQESARNRTQTDWCLYDPTGYNDPLGPIAIIHPGSTANGFSNNTKNIVSSLKPC